MSLKFVIDMNLSPQWVEFFKKNNLEAVHWSEVGDKKAPDSVIMKWAKEKDHVVFTHDLDFGALLAVTQATGPSVIQIRTQNVMPDNLGKSVVSLINQYKVQLERGALLILDETSNRVRFLPLIR